MMDKLKAAWNWLGGIQTTGRAAVLCALVGFVVGGATCRSWRRNLIDVDAPPPGLAFGWRDDPAYVARVVSQFNRPFFGDAAKNLIQQTPEKDAFLWQAYERATGHAWRPHQQNPVGSCVGHGASGAAEILSAVQKALGEPIDYHDISAATIYGFSREIGDYLGNQDGSTGADAAKAMMTLGNLSCSEAGDDNVNNEIGAPLCKKWGRTGVPNELRPSAKKHLIKTASRVRYADEVRVALTNGYPVTIASNVGFEDRRGNVAERDKDGRIEPAGNWAHQMFVGGYRADKQWYLVFQSWGGLPRGPKTLGQPEGTFWITKATMQRIVSTGEAYALSGFDGYESQDLDWRVQLPVREPRHVAARILNFSLAW